MEQCAHDHPRKFCVNTEHLDPQHKVEALLEAVFVRTRTYPSAFVTGPAT